GRRCRDRADAQAALLRVARERLEVLADERVSAGEDQDRGAHLGDLIDQREALPGRELARVAGQVGVGPAVRAGERARARRLPDHEQRRLREVEPGGRRGSGARRRAAVVHARAGVATLVPPTPPSWGAFARPDRGAFTRQAMFPCGWRFSYMSWWTYGICSKENVWERHGSTRPAATRSLSARASRSLAKCDPCSRFWRIQR